MSYAHYVLGGLNIGIGYAEQLTKTIPAEQFAHFPAKDVVCPAFYLAHLAIYPHRALGMLGRADLVVPNPAGWDDRFKAGVIAQPGEWVLAQGKKEGAAKDHGNRQGDHGRGVAHPH